MAEAQAQQPPRVRIDPATVKAEPGKRGYVVSAVGLDGTHYLYDGPVLDRREARGLRAMLRERAEIHADPQQWYAEPAARASEPQHTPQPTARPNAAQRPTPALAVHLAIGPQPAPSVARAPAGLQAEVSAQRAVQVLDAFRAYENQVRNFADAQRHARDLARAGVVHAPQAAARLAANRWSERIEETATRAAGLGIPRHLLSQYAADRTPGFRTQEAARRAALASVGVSLTLDTGPTPERPLGRASAAQLAGVYLASIARRAEAGRKYHMNSPEAKRLADTRHFTAQREAQAVADELRARLGLNRPAYRVEAQPFAGQKAPALSPERQKQRQQEAQAAVQAIRQRSTRAAAAAPAVAPRVSPLRAARIERLIDAYGRKGHKGGDPTMKVHELEQQLHGRTIRARLSPIAASLAHVQRTSPVVPSQVQGARGPDREAMIQGWGRHNRPPESARPYEIPARSAPAAEPQRVTQASPERIAANRARMAAELKQSLAEADRNYAADGRAEYEAGKYDTQAKEDRWEAQTEGRADPAPKQPESPKLAPITPAQKAATENARQAMVREVERAEAGRKFRPDPAAAIQARQARYDVPATAAAAREVARAWIASKGKTPIAHDQVREVAKQSMQRGRAQ